MLNLFGFEIKLDVGVDLIKLSYKAYICFLVCMSTKAVHLELVSDLSSTAFIKALRRFVITVIRGRCARLYSDNGINFKGAERELRQMLRAASEFYDVAASWTKYQ